MLDLGLATSNIGIHFCLVLLASTRFRRLATPPALA
jgi:hypothetical protein